MKIALQFTNKAETQEYWVTFRLRNTRIAQAWADMLMRVPPPREEIFEIYEQGDHEKNQALVGDMLLKVLRHVNDFWQTPLGEPELITKDYVDALRKHVREHQSDFSEHRLYEGRSALRHLCRLARAAETLILRAGGQNYPGMISWEYQQGKIELYPEDMTEFRIGQQYGTLYLTNPNPPSIIDCYWGNIPFSEGKNQTEWSQDFLFWMGPSWSYEFERQVRNKIREQMGDSDLIGVGNIPLAVIDPVIPLDQLWAILIQYPVQGKARYEE